MLTTDSKASLTPHAPVLMHWPPPLNTPWTGSPPATPTMLTDEQREAIIVRAEAAARDFRTLRLIGRLCAVVPTPGVHVPADWRERRADEPSPNCAGDA